MDDLLDLAEHAGRENMRERIDNAGMIQREANTVMALLLVGAGAALAYAGGAVGPCAAGAALAVSVYLFGLAALLNWRCLGLTGYPASFNEPANLNRPEYEVDQVRLWELENLQARINQAVAINDRRSAWLNGCRYAAALTPLVAAIGWGVGGL